MLTAPAPVWIAAPAHMLLTHSLFEWLLAVVSFGQSNDSCPAGICQNSKALQKRRETAQAINA